MRYGQRDDGNPQVVSLETLDSSRSPVDALATSRHKTRRCDAHKGTTQAHKQARLPCGCMQNPVTYTH